MTSTSGRIIAVITIALIGLCISLELSAKAPAAAAAAPKALSIKRNMKIDDCAARGIVQDQILFIYSHSCPYCKEALPIVERVVKNHSLESRYVPVDTLTDEGQDKLAGWGIEASYVPLLIKDCRAYVGSRDEKEYERILTGK